MAPPKSSFFLHKQKQKNAGDAGLTAEVAREREELNEGKSFVTQKKITSDAGLTAEVAGECEEARHTELELRLELYPGRALASQYLATY